MKREEKPITRKALFGAYLDNMVTFLQTQNPDVPRAKIEAFCREFIEKKSAEMKKRLRDATHSGADIDAASRVAKRGEKLWPTIQVVKHIDPEQLPRQVYSYGNSEIFDHDDLLKFIGNIKNKIIAPLGSVYETADRKISMLKKMIVTDKASRKAEKKLMLESKKMGDADAAMVHNNKQSTIKIRMNSLIGGMGSMYNFLSSIPNFNSVTSISRFFISNTYTHAERFIESNFYFLNEEQVLNFLVTCKNSGPSGEEVERVLDMYGLYCPTADDVFSFLSKNLSKYKLQFNEHPIRQFVSMLSPGERAFVFYMSNMKNLVIYNDAFFRDWIEKLFNPVVDEEEECSPADVASLDADLIIMLSVVFNKLLPKNSKGNSISIYDAIVECPEVAVKFYRLGKAMQKQIDDFSAAFDIFMKHRVGIGYTLECKHMYRDTVILSDTDSIIFTTKSWLEWYRGSLAINEDAYAINSLIVYWLCKANRFVLYHLSRSLGAVGDDLFTMNAKNEFTMPIQLLTILKKHYASILKIQEGVIYDVPVLDIKGVNLRGSSFSKWSLDYIFWFIQSIMDSIGESGKVSANEKILDVLRFERYIRSSLENGETKFLTVNPVRPENEYTNSDASIFFNYLGWEEIFGEKYGHIAIPTKCFVVPLRDVTDLVYQDFLRSQHADIYEKFSNFLRKNPKKKFTRIPINPLIDSIPVELRGIIDYKKIVYANTKPLYLILHSLGIVAGNNTKNIALMSDIYGWVANSETAGVRKILSE